MKKLSRMMALFAIGGMTTFLTGCGDDDGGDEGGQVIITAPQNEAQLRSQQYTLNVAGDPNAQVLIFPDQGRYEVTSAGVTTAGSYSNPTFSANQATVTLTPDNQDAENQPGVLTMTFSQTAGSGTFAFTPATGEAEQGTFTFTPVDPGTTDGGGGGELAPQDHNALVAQSYTASTVDGAVVLSFPDANSYQITSDDGTESGAFTATRSENTWTLNLAPTTGDPNATLALTWTAADGGTFVYTPEGGQAESGTFVEGTDPGTTNGGGGGGNNNAPANVLGSWNLNVPVGLFTGEFVVTYDATTFSTVRASDGQPMGNGTYTYTRSGSNTDQASLVHVYGGEFVGDRDEYNLTFSSPTAATFTGSQISGGEATPASGTFSKQ